MQAPARSWSNRARVAVIALGVAASACGGEERGVSGQALRPTPAEAPPDQATVPLVGATPLPASAVAQIDELMAEKRSWSRSQQKIDSSLLLEVKRRAGARLFQAVPSLRSDVQVTRSGRVEVDIEGEVDEALLGRIRSLGGRVESSFPALHSVRAELPLEALERLADDGRVRTIQRALGYTLDKVDTSEGDVAHRAAVARSTHGLSGSGVKVGVLSNGVDTLAARVTSGDLPSGITVVSAGSGDEGTAMLEIVHDLAPGAQLLFATANGGEAQFATNIRALRDQGAKVIVDDVYYYGESAFQDDVVAQAVEDVTSSGVVYLSAAGNGGNLSHSHSSVWEGDFLLSSSNLAPVNDYEGLTAQLHDFTSGQYWNSLTSDPTGYITLEWSDPRLNAGSDYDLFVMNSTLTTIVAASINSQGGSGTIPFEGIDSTTRDDNGNRVVIARYSGSGRYLRVNANVGAQLALGTTGQISGHAAAVGATAVAAVNVATASGSAFVGGGTNPVEYYSADGPRRVFYLADSTPITAGNFSATGGSLRNKPDIAAADGVSTSTPGFKPFFGTSAAAPHAAAIAALLREQNPTFTVAQIKAYLTATALDIEGAGSDRNAGSGIAMANRATAGCTYMPNGTICDDGSACTTGDACSGGSCVGTPLTCTDGNGCTDDSCNPASGCVFTNNTAPCSDGSACTAGDACSGGSCHAGAAVVCNDDNACTNDSCNPASGCIFTNNTASCSDGSACTVGDVCSGGSCQPGTPLVCNDGNGCTDDSCNPSSGCVFANNTAPCSDGSACTSGDHCAGGSCQPGASVTCNDGNVCTDDGCDPSSGCVFTNNTASCSDGNACTVSDTCGGGTCTGQPKTCPPSDECHTGGSCAADGSCSNPPVVNGTSCAGGECRAGVCTPVSASGGTGGTGTGGTGTGGESGAGAGGEAGDTSGGTGAEPHAGGSAGSAGGAGRLGNAGNGHGGTSSGAAPGLGGAGETGASGGATAQGGTPSAGGRADAGNSAAGEGNLGNDSQGGSGSPAGGRAGTAGRADAGAANAGRKGATPPSTHKSGCNCTLPSRRSDAPWSAFGGLFVLGLIARRRGARRRAA